VNASMNATAVKAAQRRIGWLSDKDGGEMRADQGKED